MAVSRLLDCGAFDRAFHLAVEACLDQPDLRNGDAARGGDDTLGDAEGVRRSLPAFLLRKAGSLLVEVDKGAVKVTERFLEYL